MNINKEDIYIGLDKVSKDNAILMAGNALVNNGYVKKSYIDTMFSREKITSTYIGNGVGIPHGTDEGKKEVLQSGVVILQFKEGIEYNNEIAHLVIGIAGKGNDHLDILSELAVELSDESKVDKLVQANSADEFLELISKGN